MKYFKNQITTKTIKKGTVVHINGMPFTIKKKTKIEGHKANFRIIGL